MWRIWRDWRWFACALTTLLIFRSVIGDWNQVPTGSMSPTIAVGDQVVVDKRAYGIRLPFSSTRLIDWQAPKRGDIVTFESPVDGTLYVKRIVAGPGDMVAMHDNLLAVNGIEATYREVSQSSSPGYVTLEETLLDSSRLVKFRQNPSPETIRSFGPVILPEATYLMLGDNRDESFDSRYFGFVEQAAILGRARAIAFSLDYERSFQLRPERALAALR